MYDVCIKEKVDSLVAAVGELGNNPSIVDCDFYDTYGIYPWDSNISEDYVYNDHGWARDVSSYFETVSGPDLDRLNESIKQKEIIYSAEKACDIKNSTMEKKWSGIYWLNKNAVIFYFLAWLNNACKVSSCEDVDNPFGLSSVIIEKFDEIVRECEGNISLSDVRDVAQYISDEKKYITGFEIRDKLLHLIGTINQRIGVSWR